MRVDDQNGSSTLGKGRVYQRRKNILAVYLTLVETLLVVFVRTNALVKETLASP